MNRTELLKSLRKPPAKTAPEQHYKVAEVAKLWGISPAQVRKLFRNEEGVMLMGREQGTGSKRPYGTLLISASALARVQSQLSQRAS